MSSLYPEVRVEVELAGAGNGWTNLASDVVPGSLEIEHGMTGRGPTDLLAGTGSCRFELHNSAQPVGPRVLGWYSTQHANKRSGWDLNIALRVRITDPATQTVYVCFVGKIASIVPEPGVYGRRTVAVEAVSWLDVAATWRVTAAVAPGEDQRGDQLVAAIVAAMPEAPPATSYDAGPDSFRYGLSVGEVERTTAMSEFARICLSGFDRIFEQADGTLRYESRHTRLTNTTVAWTITDAELTRDGLTMPAERDAVLNSFAMTAHPKVVDAAATSVVYSQASVIEIPAGETKTLIGPYRDQETGDRISATDVQAQVSGSDYLGNSRADGLGTDLTSDLTVTVTAGANGCSFAVENTGAAVVFLTRNQLIGRRVMDRATDTRKASDASSITTYGERVMAIDMPYQDSGEVAEGAATYHRDGYASPLPEVETVRVLGSTSAKITSMLSCDISDRVRVIEEVTGLDAQGFINRKTLTVLPGPILECALLIQPAIDPAGGATYFQWDTSSWDGTDVWAPF